MSASIRWVWASKYVRVNKKFQSVNRADFNLITIIRKKYDKMINFLKIQIFW